MLIGIQNFSFLEYREIFTNYKFPNIDPRKKVTTEVLK